MRKTLVRVKTGKVSLPKYKKLVNSRVYGNLSARAKNKKIKVLHVNSTANGGGVAELLKSQIPMEKGIGIDSHWITMNNLPGDSFFFVTKKIHNLLQGQKGKLTHAEKKHYLLHNKLLFDEFSAIIKKIKPNVIVIHDPQPLPLIDIIPKNIKTILRIHIDLSVPNKQALQFIKPFILKFDSVIVAHPLYAPKWIPKNKVRIIQPSIDPFNSKNKILSKKEIAVLIKKYKEYNLSQKDKIICQISRFDKWKDPVGVIKAFHIAKKKIPELKLVLIGSVASDDPESAEVFEEVQNYVRRCSNVILFNERDSKFVNLIQSISSVVLQKSLREGFGLTITEAMWKKKVVIGGKTAGIGLQIKNGYNGVLVSSIKQTADQIVELIKKPNLAKKMGEKGKLSVRKKFITPIMVEKHLAVYNSLL
jgi:trehalose synthase